MSDVELSTLGDAEFLPYAQDEDSVVLRLGDDWLALDDWENGWVTTKADLGAPVSRDSVYDWTGGDGTVDNTTRVGGRNITIGLSIVHTNPQALLDLLAPYLSQRVRPTLEVATVRGEPRRSLLVRHTADLDVSWERPGFVDVTLGFRSVGWPYWRSLTEGMATAWPDEVTPGRTYDRTYDRTYPSSANTGAALITNAGSVDVPWVARIFGPITAPELILGATQERVVFKSTLSIAAGDWLEVDSHNRTALINGLVGSPRYSHLDFPATDWFLLPPGDSTMTLYGTGTSTSTQAEVTWHDSFL